MEQPKEKRTNEYIGVLSVRSVRLRGEMKKPLPTVFSMSSMTAVKNVLTETGINTRNEFNSRSEQSSSGAYT